MASVKQHRDVNEAVNGIQRRHSHSSSPQRHESPERGSNAAPGQRCRSRELFRGRSYDDIPVSNAMLRELYLASDVMTEVNEIDFVGLSGGYVIEVSSNFKVLLISFLVMIYSIREYCSKHMRTVQTHISASLRFSALLMHCVQSLGFYGLHV